AFQAKRAELSAPAALLVAAPRALVIGEVIAVHPGDTSPDGFYHAVCARHIITEDRSGQTKWRVICHLDGFLLGLELLNDNNRSQDFFLHNSHIGFDAGEDRRIDVIAGAILFTLRFITAEFEFGAFFLADFDVFENALLLNFAYQRTHFGVLIQARSD